MSHDNLHVKLCNQDVHIVSKEIYLGNYINENIYDISWRKIMRKLFKLPNRITHNYIVCGIVECIYIKLDRRLAKFVCSMLNNGDLTVFKLIRLFLKSDSLTFAENI